MAEILIKDVWSTITKFAKKSKKRNVAVAYLGNNAIRLLPLDKDDSLVVDMSDASVKTGQTNPYEVGKYLKKGVRVYSCSNLHAKVFVFDDTLIVGSTNVSQNSKENLIEAALLSQNKHTALKAIEWLKSLQKQEVTPEYVRYCKEIYNPPKPKGYASRKSEPDFSTIWLLSTEPTEYTDQENKLCQKIEHKVSKKSNSTKYEIESIRWNDMPRITENIKEGNLIIQIHKKKKNKTIVYPPSYLKRITNYLTPDERKRVFLTLEIPKHHKTIPWKVFYETAKKAGLNRISENSCRRVTSAEAKNAILSLWNKTKLAQK